MALYTYQCKDCDKQFEAMVSLSKRNNLQTCGKCGGSAKKLMTAPSGIFIDGAGSITNRGDSFWANAERNKNRDIVKKQSAQTEKLQFGDKETVKKQENKINNYNRFGMKQNAINEEKKLDKK